MLVAGSVVQSANQVQIQVQARTIKVSFVQNAVANAKLQATDNGRPLLYLIAHEQGVSFVLHPIAHWLASGVRSCHAIVKLWSVL